MRRTAVVFTAVALVLSTTAGCGSLQSSATEVGGERMTDDRPVRDGGTLTVALNADPDKLDPSLAETLVGRTVFAGMCEKLYDVDEAGKVVPQLATALPKTSPDGRTVTFSVRKGLKFSDGTSLDAAAVVTSLLRHRDLPGSARATELAPLKGAEATGAYSVKLTLKQAYVPLTAVLADRSGMVMSPPGCRFHTRCPLVVDRCRTEVPELRSLDGGREVSCHLVADDGTAPDAAAPRPTDADDTLRTIPHTRPASA